MHSKQKVPIVENHAIEVKILLISKQWAARTLLVGAPYLEITL